MRSSRSSVQWIVLPLTFQAHVPEEHCRYSERPFALAITFTTTVLIFSATALSIAAVAQLTGGETETERERKKRKEGGAKESQEQATEQPQL